ncbi:MAG: hypothetical protein LOX97_02060 [Sphingomonas sp.]|nr:hypothetical protein [Sphingomonas sp.]
MNWNTVRLELAANEAFPRGSPGRAFLLHVPMDGDGLIDPEAVVRDPGRATVRRFWGSEPDSFGPIEAGDAGWSLRCGQGTGEKSTFILEKGPLRLNREISIGEPGGAILRFRVASVRSTDRRS